MEIITKRIKENIPFDLINQLWEMYYAGYPKNTEKDHYQFFKIEQTKITMWQEIPKQKKVIDYQNEHQSEAEIWIIDDGEVHTMLFPEDY